MTADHSLRNISSWTEKVLQGLHTCVRGNMDCSRRCSFVSFDERLLVFHKTKFLQ